MDASTVPTPILPPRPNLGPELLPEPQATPLIWVVALLTIGAVAILLSAIRMRRRRRASKIGDACANAAFPDTPQIQAAEEIRRAMIDRFGQEYEARTTEELCDDLRLKEAIGADRLAEVVAILGAADVEKFGGKVDETLDPEALAQRLSVLLASIRAGAISSKSGRWSEPMSGPMRRETTVMPSETKA